MSHIPWYRPLLASAALDALTLPGAARAGLNTQWSYVPPACTAGSVNGSCAAGNSGVGSGVVPIGDFNNDGNPDVALPVAGWVPPGQTTRQGGVMIWLGTGAGAGLPTNPGTPHYLITAAGGTSSGFGASVSPAGDLNDDGYDDIVIGAIYERNTANTAEVGAVHVAYGRPGTPSTGLPNHILPGWRFKGDNLGPYFGWAVAGNVDVNCDGELDLLVTSHAAYGPNNSCQELADLATPQNDTNYTGVYAGVVVAFYGTNDASNPGGTGIRTAGPHWSAYGSAYLTEFGWGLAGVGDFNGDRLTSLEIDDPDNGCDDFVVGSPRWGWYEAHRGAVHVFIGDHDDPDVACDGPRLHTPSELVSDDYILDYHLPGARFGEKLSPAGDVNGDGLMDFAVSSPGYDDTNATYDEGGFWIVYGDDALNALPSAAISFTNQSQTYLGASATWAGDVDGDGYDDVIVGAPGFDGAVYNQGRTYLFRGSASGLVTTPAATFDSAGYWASGGQGASGVGDIDGDGKDEMWVGAPGWDTNYGVNVGKLFLLDYTP